MNDKADVAKIVEKLEELHMQGTLHNSSGDVSDLKDIAAAIHGELRTIAKLLKILVDK